MVVVEPTVVAAVEREVRVVVLEAMGAAVPAEVVGVQDLVGTAGPAVDVAVAAVERVAGHVDVAVAAVQGVAGHVRVTPAFHVERVAVHVAPARVERVVLTAEDVVRAVVEQVAAPDELGLALVEREDVGLVADDLDGGLLVGVIGAPPWGKHVARQIRV